MSSLSRARVAIIGGGALGMATAAALAAQGVSPVVFDPAQAASASAVAAGMISPAFEAALEGVSRDRADLYRRAAIEWRGFDAVFDLGLICDGADWRGPTEPIRSELERLDFAFRQERGGLHLPGEARLNARQALQRLNASVEDAGGQIVSKCVTAVDETRGRPVVRLPDDAMEFDAVVLAAGWSAGGVTIPGLESLTARIVPVRGQLQFVKGPGATAIERITRTRNLYLVPMAEGLVIGATMEPGRTDTVPDPETTSRLTAAAIELEPALADTRFVAAAVGIRGAAPDGLPIAGATSRPGVFAALAPRRGGWLHAPLVAGAVVAALSGCAAPAWAEAFRPDRFDPA